MVRWLVENHRLGIREQDARELDAPSLATRERLEFLVEDAVGQVQVRRDCRGLALRRITAERHKLVVKPRVAAHRLVLLRVGHRLGHRGGRLGESLPHRAEPARIQDAVAGGLLRVAGAGILRQVAELTRAVDLAVTR